jgi:hypothetical protein
MADNARQDDVLYNVSCWNCGQVWIPAVRSPLWWKAKKRAEKGFLDALCVAGTECGCQSEVLYPDAPYRIVGYDDMGSKFDIPYESMVPAAKKYLELARTFMYSIVFVDKRAPKGKLTRLQLKLHELEWA